jgi:hypothetical protein
MPLQRLCKRFTGVFLCFRFAKVTESQFAAGKPQRQSKGDL